MLKVNVLFKKKKKNYFIVFIIIIIIYVGQYGSEYEYDNKALGYLLKGACLRIMNSPFLAEECLKSVVSMEKKIKEDRYLVPYAHVELAFLHKTKGNLEKAAFYLETAKYTAYIFTNSLSAGVEAV